ncbi:MAG: phosphoribosylanthranilate isomerase [Oscillospiraceae bacterium]|nr:phosphoribosylanthranilate isomerase [Oscillospiraceae bacterium]
MTKIKICGLSREADIAYVNEAKPDYCGFIIDFPKSHRSVSPARVRELVGALDAGIAPVGVFVNAAPELVADMLRDGTLALAQLHGGEDEDYISRLRRLTDKPLIKAFKIKSAADLPPAAACSADYVLLDSGAGSGETFDWSLLRGFPRPFFLAGGLGPENLRRAIAEVQPMAVDMSSGVETDKIKDREKILAAVAAVRESEAL